MKSLCSRTIAASSFAALLLLVPVVPLSAQTADTPPFAANAISNDELRVITGRADAAMIIRAENSSTVSHNSVIGESTTGGISFDSQALQNLSGLSVISANTGNNVSINSSLNLNVAIHP